MEFKGTKGKWEASYQDGKPGHCFTAQVFVDGTNMAIIEATEDEQEANANVLLMANAPKLLSALQDAVTGLEWRRDEPNYTFDKADEEKLQEWKELIKNSLSV